MSTIKTNTIENVAGSKSFNTDDISDAVGSLLVPTGFRNKLINGGFGIVQRGTGGFASGVYNADRWYAEFSSGNSLSVLNSPNEDNNYISLTLDGNATFRTAIGQKIEYVGICQGNYTASFSMDNTTVAGTNEIQLRITQVFGDGGSASVTTYSDIKSAPIGVGVIEFTVAIPSIDGETVGVNSYTTVELMFHTTLSGTFRLKKAQLEEGSVATPFEQRPIGYELSLCQRYYWKGVSAGNGLASHYGDAGNVLLANMFSFQSTMRVSPTITETGHIYENCTHNAFIISKDSFVERVNVAAIGTFRAYSGTYFADAEL